MSDTSTSVPIRFPRVTIEFCVQCKWNLRAAYFAQELLQTFSTSIGEISLIPVTGGIFTISLYNKEQPSPPAQSEQQSPAQGVTAATDSPQKQESVEPITVQATIIWDRKRDGGFPETKELKNRVRNIIEPGKDMGHVDRALKKGKEEKEKKGEEEDAVATAIGEGKSSTEQIANADADADESKVKTSGDDTGGDAATTATAQIPESTEEKAKVDVKIPPADCEDCK